MKASAVIREKLIENNGSVKISSLQGKPIFIQLSPDGQHFFCDKIKVRGYEDLAIFDCITDLLDKNHGKAFKGNGRNFKLGQSGCELDTVVGYLGYTYDGHKIGDSVFDPVFALCAIMDWAGIVKNCRGYIEYTPKFKLLHKNYWFIL